MKKNRIFVLMSWCLLLAGSSFGQGAAAILDLDDGGGTGGILLANEGHAKVNIYVANLHDVLSTSPQGNTYGLPTEMPDLYAFVNVNQGEYTETVQLSTFFEANIPSPSGISYQGFHTQFTVNHDYICQPEDDNTIVAIPLRVTLVKANGEPYPVHSYGDPGEVFDCNIFSICDISNGGPGTGILGGGQEGDGGTNHSGPNPDDPSLEVGVDYDFTYNCGVEYDPHDNDPPDHNKEPGTIGTSNGQVFMLETRPTENNTQEDRNTNTVIESNLSNGVMEQPSAPTEMSLTLFPNPASEMINLRMSVTTSTNLELTIYTADGQRVYTHRQQAEQGTYTHSVNIKDWTAGYYYGTLLNNGELQHFKMVKID